MVIRKWFAWLIGDDEPRAQLTRLWRMRPEGKRTRRDIPEFNGWLHGNHPLMLPPSRYEHPHTLIERALQRYIGADGGR